VGPVMARDNPRGPGSVFHYMESGCEAPPLTSLGLRSRHGVPSQTGPELGPREQLLTLDIRFVL